MNDLEFLIAANIMESVLTQSMPTCFDPRCLYSYSLLLGIDDENQRLSLGLIDALSSYDLGKFFESKGKLMLKSASTKQDVTVCL